MSSRLASILVGEGLVAPHAMVDAFQRQVIYGGALDTILLEMNAVDEPTLNAALGRALGVPPAQELPAEQPSGGGDTWLTRELAERYRAVPLERQGAHARVLVAEPLDRGSLDELGSSLNVELEPVVALELRFAQAMQLVYGVPMPARLSSLAARLRPPRQARPAKPAPAPAPEPSRTVISDVPLPPPAAPEPIVQGAETPRLTLREAAAPIVPVADAPTTRIDTRGEPEPSASAEAPPSSAEGPLPSAEAVQAIEGAENRDEIFAALCRGARGRAAFVSVLTVHGEIATGKIALGEGWIDREILAQLAVPLGEPSSIRTMLETRAPYLGRLGEDAVTRAMLEALGRKCPVHGLLYPLLLKDRVVAILLADAAGAKIAPEEMAEVSTLVGAASRAFQRLILAAKKGRSGSGPVEVGPAAQTQTGKALVAAALAGPRAAEEASTPDTAHADAPGTDPSAAGTDTPSHLPEVLLAVVGRGDAMAGDAAERLLALREEGADLVVSGLPGTLKVAPPGTGDPEALTRTPLQDHGPLIALTLRFGRLAVQPLLPRLDDARPEVRYYATRLLDALGSAATIEALGRRLFDSASEVRRAAIAAIAACPESNERRELLERLRAELPGPDSMRQRHAADALGTLHDAPCVPRLIELVGHYDTALANAAHAALVEISRQDLGESRRKWRAWWDRHRRESRTEWLLESLGHSEERIRRAALEELSGLVPDTFGYRWDASKREREDARRRLVGWWQSHGAKLPR